VCSDRLQPGRPGGPIEVIYLLTWHLDPVGDWLLFAALRVQALFYGIPLMTLHIEDPLRCDWHSGCGLIHGVHGTTVLTVTTFTRFLHWCLTLYSHGIWGPVLIHGLLVVTFYIWRLFTVYCSCLSTSTLSAFGTVPAWRTTQDTLFYGVGIHVCTHALLLCSPSTLYTSVPIPFCASTTGICFWVTLDTHLMEFWSCYVHSSGGSTVSSPSANGWPGLMKLLLNVCEWRWLLLSHMVLCEDETVVLVMKASTVVGWRIPDTISHYWDWLYYIFICCSCILFYWWGLLYISPSTISNIFTEALCEDETHLSIWVDQYWGWWLSENIGLTVGVNYLWKLFVPGYMTPGRCVHGENWPPHSHFSCHSIAPQCERPVHY
jgi:hypothetical protein